MTEVELEELIEEMEERGEDTSALEEELEKFQETFSICPDCWDPDCEGCWE